MFLKNNDIIRRCVRARVVHRRSRLGQEKLQACRIASQSSVQRHAGGPRVRGQHVPVRAFQRQQALPLSGLQEAAKDRSHLHFQLVLAHHPASRALDASRGGYFV